MKIVWTDNYLTIQREQDDPKFGTESHLLYFLKSKLTEQGYDLIKKRMWKDDHLVDYRQQYLRTRSPKSSGPHVYIWNGHWAIEGAEREWNAGNEVTLCVERDVFNAA